MGEQKFYKEISYFNLFTSERKDFEIVLGFPWTQNNINTNSECLILKNKIPASWYVEKYYAGKKISI